MIEDDEDDIGGEASLQINHSSPKYIQTCIQSTIQKKPSNGIQIAKYPVLFTYMITVSRKNILPPVEESDNKEIHQTTTKTNTKHNRNEEEEDDDDSRYSEDVRKRHDDTKGKYSDNKIAELAKESFQTLGEEQWSVFQKIAKGENIMVCGPAGTGKSVVIVHAVRFLRKLKLNVSVTAMTGVAASYLNGGQEDINASTLHWWIGSDLCTGSAKEESEKIKQSQSFIRWIDTEVLVIDEVSMMDAALFDKLDQMARILRKNPFPFGGIQIVLSGDFFQLEPVIVDSSSKPYGKYKNKSIVDGDHEKSNDTSAQQRKEDSSKHVFCFQTKTYKNAFKRENVIVLTKNYRQKTDPEFQRVLEEIREGTLSIRSIELLKSRLNAPLHCPTGIRPTFLMPLVRQVEAENKNALDAISGPVFSFKMNTISAPSLPEKKADIMISMLKKKIPQVVDDLKLKIGAPVMLLVNLNVPDGLVNGAQGCVQKFDEEDGLPHVQFANGQVVKIQMYTWNSDNGKGTKRFSGVLIRQLPIKLAAALTIHKSQAMSLDYVKLDMGPEMFASGQGYVALSRCRRLDGLCLTRFHWKSIRVNVVVIQFYREYNALLHLFSPSSNNNNNKTRSGTKTSTASDGKQQTLQDNPVVDTQDCMLTELELEEQRLQECREQLEIVTERVIELLKIHMPSAVSSGTVKTGMYKRPPRFLSNNNNDTSNVKIITTGRLSTANDSNEDMSKNNITTQLRKKPRISTTNSVSGRYIPSSKNKDHLMEECPL